MLILDDGRYAQLNAESSDGRRQLNQDTDSAGGPGTASIAGDLRWNEPLN